MTAGSSGMLGIRSPAIVALRTRQRRNLVTTLMLSQGVPMLLGGDEFGRTQNGNNNAYCQDNEISWLDWDLDPTRRLFLDFTRRLIGLRQQTLSWSVGCALFAALLVACGVGVWRHRRADDGPSPSDGGPFVPSLSRDLCPGLLGGHRPGCLPPALHTTWGGSPKRPQASTIPRRDR